MRVLKNGERRKALTVPELLAVAAVLAILAAVLLPSLRPQHQHRLSCTNNLKQIGLAFRTWELDNNDRFPMQVSTNDWGTKELISGPNAYVHFAVMSNELSTPAILVCPEDSRRHRATNFTSDLNNSKISYFVGVDAVETNLDLLLSGDRNLTNDSVASKGMLVFPPQTTARWTAELHRRKGNLLLPDGSVQEVSNSSFKTPAGSINRLSMP